MLITTTPTITGHRIAAVHGVVFGLVVRSRGLGPNLLASLRSAYGTAVTIIPDQSEGRPQPTQE